MKAYLDQLNLTAYPMLSFCLPVGLSLSIDKVCTYAYTRYTCTDIVRHENSRHMRICFKQAKRTRARCCKSLYWTNLCGDASDDIESNSIERCT